MRIERLILISFLGNYLINNIVAAIVALIPLAGNTTAQYVIYFVLAALAAGTFTWWYLKDMSKSDALQQGAIFGGGAFVVAVVTAFVSGISGVLAQTGSFSQLISVLPNFGPFIWNWSTLALLGYWVLPATAVGYWMQSGGSFKMPMMKMGGGTGSSMGGGSHNNPHNSSHSGGMHATPSNDSLSM